MDFLLLGNLEGLFPCFTRQYSTMVTKACKGLEFVKAGSGQVKEHRQREGQLSTDELVKVLASVEPQNGRWSTRAERLGQRTWVCRKRSVNLAAVGRSGIKRRATAGVGIGGAASYTEIIR